MVGGALFRVFVVPLGHITNSPATRAVMLGFGPGFALDFGLPRAVRVCLVCVARLSEIEQTHPEGVGSTPLVILHSKRFFEVGYSLALRSRCSRSGRSKDPPKPWVSNGSPCNL